MSRRDLLGTLYDLSGELVASSKTDSRVLARRALNGFGRAHLFDLAVEELAELIDTTRREAQRMVERAAAHRIEALGPVLGPERMTATEFGEFQQAKIRAHEAETQDQRFREVAASPRLAHPMRWKLKDRFKLEGARIAQHEYSRFFRFMDESYADWYRAGCEDERFLNQENAFNRGSGYWHTFEADLYGDTEQGTCGYNAWHWRQLRSATDTYVDMVKAETRLEVTRELLSSVFAVGDGSKVTWGDATQAQHEARLSMLTKGIAGTAQTAALHQLAIEMIQSAGARCLAEIEPCDAANQNEHHPEPAELVSA